MKRLKTELLSLKVGVALLSTGVFALSGCKSNPRGRGLSGNYYQNQGLYGPQMAPFGTAAAGNQGGFYTKRNYSAGNVGNVRGKWGEEQKKKREEADAAAKVEAEKKKAALEKYEKEQREKEGVKADDDDGRYAFEKAKIDDKIAREKELNEARADRKSNAPKIKYNRDSPIWTKFEEDGDDKDGDGIPDQVEIDLRIKDPVKYAALDPQVYNGYAVGARLLSSDDFEGIGIKDSDLEWFKREVLDQAEYKTKFNNLLAKWWEKSTESNDVETLKKLWTVGHKPDDPQETRKNPPESSWVEMRENFDPGQKFKNSNTSNSHVAIINGGFKETPFYNLTLWHENMPFGLGLYTGVNPSLTTLTRQHMFMYIVQGNIVLREDANIRIARASSLTGGEFRDAVSGFFVLQQNALVAANVKVAKKGKLTKPFGVLTRSVSKTGTDNKSYYCPTKLTVAMIAQEEIANPAELIRENVLINLPSQRGNEYDFLPQHISTALYPTGLPAGCANVDAHQLIDLAGYKQAVSNPSTFPKKAASSTSKASEQVNGSEEVAVVDQSTNATDQQAEKKK